MHKQLLNNTMAIFVIFALCLPASVFAANVPDTRDGFMKCADSMKKAIESITPEEDAKSKGNRPYHKTLIKKMVVAPFTYNGYDFEPSVRAVADATKIIQDKISRNEVNPEKVDGELGGAILFMFKVIYSSIDHLVQYGYAEPQTKQYMTTVIDSLSKK